MNTDTSSGDRAAMRPSLIASRILSFVVALGVSACAIYAIAQGPVSWRAAQQLKTEQIKQEDETFCKKFYVPPGSENFANCVSDLAEIRRLHGARVTAEAAGVF
jgi:hypothetical protein